MNPPYENSYEKIMLALCIWREARGETSAVWRAIAHVILNRVKIGGWWGNSIISVITKPWQFSSMTAKDDPNLRIWPSDNDPQFIAILNMLGSMWKDEGDCSEGATFYYSFPLTKPPVAWGEVIPTVSFGNVHFYKGKHQSDFDRKLIANLTL